MKKKILTILIIIIGLILLLPISFLGIENYNNAKELESKMNETEQITSNENVIIAYDKITNMYLLDEFLDNTDQYNKNASSNKVEIVTYTTEGDEIVTTLEYNKEANEFIVTRDNTKDEFAAEENRRIETKKYSNDTYNLVKKIKNNNIDIILEVDSDNEENSLNDITICTYHKNLEKNKDTNRTRVQEVTLVAEETETNQLVRYKGILYGKSYGMIDYAGNPNGPIGTINRLVGEEYLPTIDGETNSEELLNALVDSANEKTMVLIYNNEAVLYRAIEEKNNAFKIIFNARKDLGIKTIISKDETDKYLYNIYSYAGDVKIKINDTEYDLRDALLNDKITMEKIIAQANSDFKNEIIEADMLKDGGTTIYRYTDYAILKYNQIGGSRDVYIGIPEMSLIGVDVKDINNITEIKTPDEIVYFDGENRIVITKDNANFERIINANKNRDLGELSMLELVVHVEDNQKHSFLEYKYNNDASIYFTINTDGANFIWIPNNSKSFVGGAYGYIDSAIELMKCFWSQFTHFDKISRNPRFGPRLG